MCWKEFSDIQKYTVCLPNTNKQFMCVHIANSNKSLIPVPFVTSTSLTSEQQLSKGKTEVNYLLTSLEEQMRKILSLSHTQLYSLQHAVKCVLLLLTHPPGESRGQPQTASVFVLLKGTPGMGNAQPIELPVNMWTVQHIKIRF